MKTPNSSSIRYFIRNFFFLFPLAVVPAFLLAIAQSTQLVYTPVDFLINIFRNMEVYSVSNFASDVYRYFSCVNTSPLWWIWAIGLISSIVGFCLITPLVERHMRLGVMSYSRLISMFNESLLMVLPYFFTAFVAYEFVSMAVSGVIYLFTMLNISGWLLFTLSLVVVVVAYGFFVAFIILTICTVPSMLTDGYKFNVAVSYSARLVATKYKSIIAKFILLIVGSVTLLMVSRVLLATQAVYTEIFHVIVAFLFYLFWMMYLPIFAMNTYIDLTEGVRKDLKVKLF